MSKNSFHLLPCVLLFACAVFAVGCAGATPGAHESLAPPHALSSVDASPSNPEDLPEGARYRIVIGDAGDVGVLVRTPDERIWGHLYLRAKGQSASEPGIEVEYETYLDDKVFVQAEAISGGLVGDVSAGSRHSSWRVRQDPSGRLHGERWSPHAPRNCPDLRRARNISTQLGELAPQLGLGAGLSEPETRVLLEQVALAELALELSLRACEARDRASLPRLTGPFAWR